MVAACADADDSQSALPEVIQTIIDGRDAPATDLFEVWVCDVPEGITDPLYADMSERVELTADSIVDRLDEPIATYFDDISHGSYRPTFAPGGMVEISPADHSQQCIDRALDRADPTADAVLVVATAQHAPDQPGGRSTPGSWLDCTARCSAVATRRVVYVGANDFHPEADDAMPLDLIEHELGHSLGLPHSGDIVGSDGNRGVGPFDLMADPAAPRTVDPQRRDAPDTLAVDRLDLGWLPLSAVHVVHDPKSDTAMRDGERVALSASAGSAGTRLVVVPIDAHSVLSIELLTNTGYDDHLPNPGVVVHAIGDAPEQCGSTTRCTDLERVQQIVGADGSGRTLLIAGDTVTVGRWTVTVETVIDDDATVHVAASRLDASHWA
jgi:M6 family metalloprotease-like protein